MSTPHQAVIEEIQTLYCSNSAPWIIGYSGGKDSTASLLLVWSAIAALPAEQRTKDIHVISTDTLVEQPVIAAWLVSALQTMKYEARRQGLPIHPHRLIPDLENRFWVNLIGKGYPAPRSHFRWCTDRLKISASEKFIEELSESHDGAILVLGQRRGESVARDVVMSTYSGRSCERLGRHPKLPRVWVYLPMEAWTSDDIWMYSQATPIPWGVDNQDLFDFYKGVPLDAKCQGTVDKSTPSCGERRFNCYVCTVSSEENSMAAMIQKEEKMSWMQPIFDFCNTYLSIHNKDKRDFQHMHGHANILSKRNKLIPGAYLQQFRAQLLEELLRTQKAVRAAKVPGHDQIELISLDEMDAIRRIWVEERGEVEDLVPQIYQRVFDKPYPGKPLEPHLLETRVVTC